MSNIRLRATQLIGTHATTIARACLLVGLASLPGSALAQSQTGGVPTVLEITKSAQAGGGGRASGGIFVMDATIAQAATGDMNGGVFDVTSGLLAPDGPVCVRSDLNCDGTIDGADLGLLLLNWGDCEPSAARCIGDINLDGAVNGADLGLLLLNWG
jgi:hypothetical protein